MLVRIIHVFIHIFLLTGPLQILAQQLKLNPPWIQTLQHVNEDYMVKCEGNGDKKWKNPAGVIITNSGNSVYTIDKSNENALYLKFIKIQKDHKGVYNCTSSYMGNKYTIGFDLIVIKAVTFANTTIEVIVNEGEDVALDCFPDGEPPPAISWHFNHVRIDDLSPFSKYRINPRGLSLKISSVSWNDAGIYVCRAFQKILQSRDAEQIYQLKVRHKPFFPQERHLVLYGFRNKSRNLTCEVKAYPVAYFIWYRKNLPIDPKLSNVRVFNEDNISIMEVILTDTGVLGEYACEAANPMGILTQIMQLELLEEPSAPNIGINQHFVKNYSVDIEVMPFPPREFAYKIHYTEYTYCSSEEKWRRAKIYNCPLKTVSEDKPIFCNITNLKSDTKYAVRAVLWNEGGCSNFSKELIFKTKKDSISIANVIAYDNLSILFVCLVYLVML